jgi:hypothetical protein
MRVTDLDTSAYPGCIAGTPTESHGTRTLDTLHLSAIYRDMEAEALLDRGRNHDITPEELAWYGAGGFLWEHVFGMAHREAVERKDIVRPDELTLDGITGSPDGIDVVMWRVIELKFRWMSSAKFDQLEKWFWMEMVQVKGYCKLVGTREAELWVFFCNGDYRPPRPTVRAKLLEFNEQEIEESWAMIVSHARRKGWL